MKLEDIDQNFKLAGELVGDGLKKYDASKPPFKTYGVYYDEQKGFLRMPESVAENLKIDLLHLANDSAGGRIKFSTDSERFGLHAHYKRYFDMANMSRMGQSGFSLVEEINGEYKHVSTFSVKYAMDSAPDKWTFDPSPDCAVHLNSSCKLKGKKMRNYILFMPLYCGIQDLEITLDDNATVMGGTEYKTGKTVLYYGSSITQGGCASRPDNAYEAHISKWTNTDYVNLGFSGNAKGQKKVAEHLASIDCNVFVCDYDHNENTAKELEEKHYEFYKTYRAIKPNTPIIFISRPNFDKECELYERIKIIKDTIKKARASGDKKVYFINGETIMGKTPSEREVCTVDGTHPNDLGFFRMAKAIKKMLKKVDRAYR